MNKNQFTAFFRKGNRATWCVFFLCAFSIFLKCVLFHLMCFQTLPVSTLLHNPHRLSVYLSKAAMAVFVASFVFLSKRKHWTVVVSIILDIWIIANFIYFRANNLFITLDAIMMANNMNGFWSSVILYMNWNVLLFPLITTIYALLIYPIPLNTHKHFVSYLTTTLLALILWISTGVCWYNSGSYNPTYKMFVPFCPFEELDKKWNGPNAYIRESSIASYFFTCILDGINMQYYRLANNNVEFTQQEIDYLNSLYNYSNTSNITPNNNLVVLLVESLESWTLEYPQLTPSINSILTDTHTLYANKITSQVKHGVSGDGQMIVYTGLLPISTGAACMMYGNNTFPNFAHLYKQSRIYNPTTRIWNQFVMTNAYEYSELIEAPSGYCEDAQMFQVFSDSLFHPVSNIQTPQLSFLITIATHSPFESIKREYPELNLPDDTPETLKRYLTCLHYTDSCIGAFMDKFMQSDLANNTSVVITGDHTIFKEAMLGEFVPFAKKHNLSIQNGKNYCPLIIYSPSITEPIRIEDVCYQMDIYPTILSLIGAEGYYWQGFGVNLMDSTARHNRSITEEDAYILSDKLIRSNWFATQP